MATKKRYYREKQENLIDPPPGGYAAYQSFQKIINSNNGQIDEDLLEEHIKMILDKDWEEIPVSFELLNKGDQIRYTTLNQDKEYLFRTGGWVTAIDEENDPPEWMSYMAHTKSTWCVQLDDCQRLFVRRKIAGAGRRTRSTKSDPRVVYDRPDEETGFDVYLPDHQGVMQRVYSARSNYLKKRFETSKKFELAKEQGWVFRDEKPTKPKLKIERVESLKSRVSSPKIKKASSRGTRIVELSQDFGGLVLI